MHYNFGNGNNEAMLQSSRPAVEKFIFNKLYTHIFEMYKVKYSDLNEKLHNKRKALQDTSDAQLMAQLGIRGKFQLESSENPYKRAIDTLGKLSDFNSPSEKFNCILSAIATMKTLVLDYWKGKVELESMDDELPLLIFVVARNEDQYFASEISLLLDYSKTSVSLESEYRLLTNFHASISYIVNDWE